MKPQHIPIHNLLPLKKDWKSERAGHLGSPTFSEKNKEDCVSIVTSLLSKQRNDPFLKNIITDDEKWAFYVEILLKRQLIEVNESLQPSLPQRRSFMKEMLCCIYEGITVALFILKFETAFAYSMRRREKIIDLGWSVRPHPLYSQRLCNKWFPSFLFSTKFAKWKKCSQKYQMKTFVENF